MSSQKPFSLEVYGFSAAMTTVVITATIILLAYSTDDFLHRIGIIYYPNRYWYCAIPAMLIVTILYLVTLYVLCNLKITNETKSPCVVQDNLGRRFTPSDQLDMEMLYAAQQQYEAMGRIIPEDMQDPRPIPQSFDIPPTLMTEHIVRGLMYEGKQE